MQKKELTGLSIRNKKNEGYVDAVPKKEDSSMKRVKRKNRSNADKVKFRNCFKKKDSQGNALKEKTEKKTTKKKILIIAGMIIAISLMGYGYIKYESKYKFADYCYGNMTINFLQSDITVDKALNLYINGENVGALLPGETYSKKILLGCGYNEIKITTGLFGRKNAKEFLIFSDSYVDCNIDASSSVIMISDINTESVKKREKRLEREKSNVS